VAHSLNLTDAELIARLTQTEDSFVERKSKSDKGGWLKTVVAFANSVPVGLPAVLFIGVNDDGQIAESVDTEKAMQIFSDFIGEHAWPPVYSLARDLTHHGRSCIAVIVPGSPERPHFAGKAFVRAGTQTKEASDAQYTELIASRNSKVSEILAWIGREITFVTSRTPPSSRGCVPGRFVVGVRFCNCESYILQPNISRHLNRAWRPAFRVYSQSR